MPVYFVRLSVVAECFGEVLSEILFVFPARHFGKQSLVPTVLCKLDQFHEAKLDQCSMDWNFSERGLGFHAITRLLSHSKIRNAHIGRNIIGAELRGFLTP